MTEQSEVVDDAPARAPGPNKSSNQSERSGFRWRPTETVWLALAPISGMMVAYVYEAGRFSLLDVPFAFIEMPLSRLFAAGFAFSGFILIVFNLLESFFPANTNSRIKKFLWFLSVHTLIFMSPALLLLGDNLVSLALSFLFPVGLAIAAAFGHLSEAERNEESKASDKIANAKAFGFLAVVLLVNAFALGSFVELASPPSLCVKSEANTFVAAIYGGSYVLKKFDPKTGRVSGDVKLVTIDDLELERCLLVSTRFRLDRLELHRKPWPNDVRN